MVDERQGNGRTKPSIWLSWGRLFLPLVIAVAVAVIVVPRLVDGPLEATSGDFAVHALCLAPGSADEVLAKAGPQQTLRCPTNGTVRFTYSAPSATRIELALAQGEKERTLLPFDSQSAALGPGNDAPLPLSSSAEAFGEGTHKVKARFADPQTGEKLDVEGPVLELFTKR